ncbi:cytosolic endo-beta-N-acetylglucosaminidase 1 [Andrographis paniculata]|uniref:cytosolic endo-beta-N-acetylglucosaminidase 1 n=1 Tax=Andrographis paniculata TaxID=175694 RepID=UPI0021E7B307|nr:cytosolic endo-beta-N-acetylglucosaminidase 1 [Andrographis paniculata]
MASPPRCPCFPLLSYIKFHHPRLFSALKTLTSLLSSIVMDSSPAAADTHAADAPPFDPSKPAVPIAYPLKTLDELESRAYFTSFHYPFNRAAVKLGGAAAALPNRPRILVCHDMAGGYTDDRFVQGGDNADAYAIWHWYLIDVFVYFSHNMVTLPPPCWTNTAHSHGVKVLGTFIFEWDEGKEQANKLLSTKESARMYAERLTELAVALGFDGWLLNFEVELDVKQIPNLKEFVSHLSKAMHSSLPGSLVIWYDSVTVDGDLAWQDQLNEKNKAFFDLCDGIFTNYTWKENYPKLSGDVAGDRKFDVYVGIDVFGRNTYGGGQWTTNVALDVIKKSDVSAAIFAPGWVYETKQEPDFQTAQNRWWGLVENSWGTVQKYPKELPFYSNFDQGRGFHVYHDGLQVSSAPWNNISLQSFQPFIEYAEDSAKASIKVSVNLENASYNGGGNITFSGTLDDRASEFTARLFKAELCLGKSPVSFTYSVKSSNNSLLGLALISTSAVEEEKRILLAAPGNALLTTTRFAKHFETVIMPREVTSLGDESGWFMQKSTVDMPGHTLKEIRAICYRSVPSSLEYNATLGDIKITSDGDDSKFPPANSWLIESRFIVWTSAGPDGSKRLSVKLVWKTVDDDDVFDKCNVYVDKMTNAASGGSIEYVGTAAGNAFYVSEMEVVSGVSGVKFTVQPCGGDGGRQKLEDCPFLVLPVEG